MKVGIVLRSTSLLRYGSKYLEYIDKIISKRIYDGNPVKEDDWNIITEPISINEYIDKCKKETIKNFTYFDVLVVDDGNIVFNLDTKIITIDFIFNSFIKECSKRYNFYDFL